MLHIKKSFSEFQDFRRNKDPATTISVNGFANILALGSSELLNVSLFEKCELCQSVRCVRLSQVLGNLFKLCIWPSEQRTSCATFNPKT